MTYLQRNLVTGVRDKGFQSFFMKNQLPAVAKNEADGSSNHETKAVG